MIASPIAYKLMQKWLENFVYKTTLDWWVFALAGLGTLVFVVTIVTLQSWNTARRNPIETLRYE
jgi:putative ABC transport system permease protein